MTAGIYTAFIVLLIYAGITLLIYLFQHFFFFRPEILPSNFKYDYPFNFEERTFEMEDGGSVNSLHFKVPNSRGVVYYFKGNSRSIKGWAKFSRDFMGNGYDFFVMDYRGFGKSKGRRTESKLYSDSQTIYKYLQKQYKEEEIIIYGRSLGSGIATRIASWNNPRMLILDSPYYSFYHHIRRYAFALPLRIILRYQIRTDQFIKKVEAPIHIIHGNKDRLIPLTNSLKLKKLCQNNIKITVIHGGGHNNLPEFPEYHKFIYKRLNEASTVWQKLEVV